MSIYNMRVINSYAMPWQTIINRFIICYAMPWQTIINRLIICYAMPWQTIINRFIICYAMPWQTIIKRFIICYVMPWQTIINRFIICYAIIYAHTDNILPPISAQRSTQFATQWLLILHGLFNSLVQVIPKSFKLVYVLLRDFLEE